MNLENFMFRKTLRTATLAVAAVAAMSLMAAESSAQCGGYGGGFNRGFGGFGGGYGGSGVAISVGRSNFGGFNNGFNSFGFNTFSRPVYSDTEGDFIRHRRTTVVAMVVASVALDAAGKVIAVRTT